MASVMELSLIIFLATFGVLNAASINEEETNVQDAIESKKIVSLPPLKILLYLPRVNFNLTYEDDAVIKAFLKERLDPEGEESTFMDVLAGLKTVIDLVNSVKGEEVFSYINYYGFDNVVIAYLVYDTMQQILDNEYEEHLLTLPIGSGKEKTEAEEGMLKLLFGKFSEYLLFPEKDLKMFYEGTSEEVVKRKQDLLNAKNKFIEYVKKGIDEVNN